jgi:hypothetical protein
MPTIPHASGAHAHVHAAQAPAENAKIPRWLLFSFAALVLLGVYLVLGRASYLENSAYDAMRNCDATVGIFRKNGSGQTEEVKFDGTQDNYASIHIRAQRNGIAEVVSLCESEPAKGLRLFRRAVKDSNKSAKLIALYCANFLAHSQKRPAGETEKGVLEAEDFASMLTLWDPATEKDADVRKVATKAISDLVVIADPKASDRVEKYPEIPKDDVDNEGAVLIKTSENTLNGKPVLLLRWSNPALARSWWKANVTPSAKWDAGLQRFVIP